MKLLITGADGQLGTELNRLGAGHELLAVGHDALDICDVSAVSRTIADFCPDVVINAAAYTAVDQAESNCDAAFAVNRDGSANLAKACELARIPLIYVSTDYVFDGLKQGAYTELDQVSPLGVYGKSKLAGELAVQQYCSRHVILRTSWVFSSHGNNFVKTMMRLGQERSELGIVNDQYGCPTSAAELGRAIYAILDAGLVDSIWGIYHFCQPESTTWFGFARAVFQVAREQDRDLKLTTVHAIATEEYPTPARRPVNSVLDCSKISKTFDFTIKPWSESLQEVINEI